MKEGVFLYFIAEIGVNHNGDMDLARRLVEKAKEIGCSAVKFQSFKAEKLASKKAPKVDYQKLTVICQSRTLIC